MNKHTPEPVVIVEEEFYDYDSGDQIDGQPSYTVDASKCPNCNYDLGFKKHRKRCPKCGQKLDWSHVK